MSTFEVKYGLFESWPDSETVFFCTGTLSENKKDATRYPDEEEFGETFMVLVPLE